MVGLLGHRGPLHGLILGVLLSGCTFQVMPDKTAIRQQQRIADALEVYLENHDTKTVKVVDHGQLPQLIPTAVQASIPWFDSLEYKYYSILPEGADRRFILEIEGKPGMWLMKIHGKTPKDTAGVTRYL